MLNNCIRASIALLAVALLAGCSEGPTNSSVSEIADLTNSTPLSSGAPSAYTNCLSYPVVFAEGHGLTGEDVAHFTGLRGTAGVESFIDPYDIIDGVPVYQNPSVNEWQAEFADGTTLGMVGCEIDWADNMTRQTWKDKSKVRVEVVLFHELTNPLTGYNMFSLGGEKLEEVFVTDAGTYEGYSATVYSNVARLKIEKLDAEGGNPTLVVYDSPCYDAYFVDGPTDAYSAEVNMGGKCIYGFNWNVRDVDATVKTGWYRLTFSLDDQATYTDYDGVMHTYPRNTQMTSINPLDLYGANDPEVVLYQPELNAEGTASVLEIYIAPGSGGKK